MRERMTLNLPILLMGLGVVAALGGDACAGPGRTPG
jgi:hypothetical protein